MTPAEQAMIPAATAVTATAPTGTSPATATTGPPRQPAASASAPPSPGRSWNPPMTTAAVGKRKALS